jgi:hypothetical protein
MRKLTIKRPIPVTLSQILDCQNQLGIVFPEVYKEFLLLNNGQYPLEGTFTKEEDWTLSLVELYCICNSESIGLLYIARMFYEKFMSKHFLPFGDDGDWIFVISMRESDLGNVYAYRTDDVEDDCLIYLDASFEAFVDKLRPDSN